MTGHPYPIHRKVVTGFGLVELLVTISIVAILAAIALPNFSTLINGNRAGTAAGDLVAAINLARNEAIARNRPVTVCAASTASGTPTACGAATAWNQGWVVFVDTVRTNASPGTITSSSVLRTGAGDSRLVVTANAAFVRFSARGEVLASADAVLTVKPANNCKAQQPRRVTVGLIGRVGTERLGTCS